jgi:serine/threonine-protein kinase
VSPEPSGLQALLDELKRRRVVRVALVYVAGGLAALQALDLVLPALGAPEALFGTLVRALVIGLPLALVLSWRYDVTPGGFVRTAAPTEAAADPRWLSAPSLLMVGALGVALGLGAAWESAAGTGAEADLGAAAAPPVDDGLRAIAVLPLDNLSPDPEDAYFSDGLTEEIRHALGRIEGVRTAARTSAQALAGRVDDVREIGRRLGVDAVLSGSVRRNGDDVRIAVALGTTSDGLEVWADAWDTEVSDVFTVQSRIAGRIADALELTLSDEDAAAIADPPTDSPMALDKYRWGRFNWNRRTPEGLRAAIGQFEEAIAFDPEFAHAWSGLADAWVLVPEYVASADPVDALSRADSAAARALELDPDLAAAHASRGLVKMLNREWDASEASYRRAIAADPDYATAHQWLGNLLMGVARMDEALASVRTARRLNPLSSVAGQDEARVLLSMGRTSDAIATLQDVIADDPGYAPAWYDVGWAFLIEGRYDDARSAFAAADERTRADPAMLAEVTEAARRYDETGTPQPLPVGLEALAAGQPVLVAAVEVRIGRTADALSRLERALEQDSWDLVTVGATPMLWPLRDEPRYRAVVAAVGAGDWLAA